MGDMWQHANDKQQLLDQIASEYARLVALVDRFSDAERVKPLVETNSLKDMLAHITDWETYALRRLRTTAIGESLPLRVPDGDFDRVNAEIYAAHKERDWADVWQDFALTHAEMVAEVRMMSESDLFDPARAEAMLGIPADSAADMIESNSSNHYWEHANEIEAALAARAG